ncbi:MAG TPA: EamA family transporter [Actinomycetes bacterium]|nr:EamA family transporter [Actinomycetes bacterium]
MTEAAAELPPLGQLRSHTYRTKLGYGMAVAGALTFAINGSVSKVTLTSGIDSLSLVLLRCSGAMVGLFLLVLIVEPRRLRVDRGEWPLLLVYGVIGIAMVQWLYFVAIARLPVGVALLLEFTAPVMVALWARFVQHQDLGRSLWLALAMSLGGLTLVAEIWEGVALDLVGVIAGLGAALSLATYYLAGKAAVIGRDTLSLAFWAFVVASVFWTLVHPWWSIPWSAMTDSVSLQGSLERFSVPVWSLIAWIVVMGTVVPFLLVIGALRHLPATSAGIVGMVEPVLAGVIAWIWLGEALSSLQVIGAIVVLIGVVLAQRVTSDAQLRA